MFRHQQGPVDESADHHFRKPANDITSQLEINFGDLGRPGRGRGGARGGRGSRGGGGSRTARGGGRSEKVKTNKSRLGCLVGVKICPDGFGVVVMCRTYGLSCSTVLPHAAFMPICSSSEAHQCKLFLFTAGHLSALLSCAGLDVGGRAFKQKLFYY